MSRRYDLIVFGASGFTGRLTARYLAENSSIKFAVAGRSRERLEKALASVLPGRTIPIEVYDDQNLDDVKRVTALATAVVTTAGPFALWGSNLVRACCATGTHYGDITGETFWVSKMQEELSQAALEKKVAIVNCCGFDSIPADLGAFTAQAYARKRGLVVDDIKGIMSGSGNVSGGTVASMLNLMKNMDDMQRTVDPFVTCGNARGPGSLTRPAEVVASTSDFPLPRRLAEFGGAAGFPFIMAAVNSRVVRKTACILRSEGAKLAGVEGTLSSPAGFTQSKPFSYIEYAAAPKKSMFVAWLATAMLAFGTFLLNVPFVPRILLALGVLPKPGQGPTQQQMDKAHFTYTFAGRQEGGDKLVYSRVRGGDGGYAETSKMLAECGILLAKSYDKIPASKLGGGFLTPASAFGLTLAKNLDAAGLKFEVLEGDKYDEEKGWKSVREVF